jgi:hypothetical protein
METPELFDSAKHVPVLRPRTRNYACFKNPFIADMMLVCNVKLLQGRSRDKHLYELLQLSMDNATDEVICHKCAMKLKKLIDNMMKTFNTMPPPIRL